MLARLIWSAAALAAAALIALSARWMVGAYGRARFETGVAVGRFDASADAVKRDIAATQAAAIATGRLVEAERRHGEDTARIAAQAAQAAKEVESYEQTAASHAACLDAERVRRIEDGRTALFPTIIPAGAEDSGS